jgi:uncharacterized protein involved in response to NO
MPVEDFVAKAACMTPDLTVRQVVARWPACASVLARFPLARQDARWTLQELAPFARDQGVDEQRLLGELATTAGVPVSDRPRPARQVSPIGLILLALGIGLTLGAGWGVALLLRIAHGSDYTAVSGASVHVHGLAQLWGWMALFIFAVGSHLLRQNTPRPAPFWLERLAALAILLALLAFFVGLWQPIHQRFPHLDVLASALLVVAAMSFGVSVVMSLGGPRQAPQRWHWFVLVAVGWLGAWTVVDLIFRLRYADAPVLPDAARQVLILLPVLGFATNAIYGFGIRLIPGLLNVGRLRPRGFTAGLVLHNLGLGLLLLGNWWMGFLGALCMLCAAMSYLAGMDLLRSKPSRPIHGVDVRGPVLIRVAFVWLALGLGMVCIQEVFPRLPHPFTGAWRHALTVGFITTMILGVGQRLVPIFIKQPLASLRLMRVAGGLIVIGNAGRVGLELLTLGGWRWAFRMMGLTGLLELAALGLFALNLAWTLRNRRRVYRSGDPLGPDTRVREAINAHPHLQQRLHEIGLTMLDEAPFIAPSMTLGAMALAWGWRPGNLLAALKDAPESQPQSERPPPPLAGTSA